MVDDHELPEDAIKQKLSSTEFDQQLSRIRQEATMLPWIWRTCQRRNAAKQLSLRIGRRDFFSSTSSVLVSQKRWCLKEERNRYVLLTATAVCLLMHTPTHLAVARGVVCRRSGKSSRCVALWISIPSLYSLTVDLRRSGRCNYNALIFTALLLRMKWRCDPKQSAHPWRFFGSSLTASLTSYSYSICTSRSEQHSGES